LAARSTRRWALNLLSVILLSAAVSTVAAAPPYDAPAILEVTSAEVCLSVERLKPVATGRHFPSNVGKLYCFSLVAGIQKQTEIHHVWHLGAERRLVVSLPVKPPSWRTYSWKHIRPADTGLWRVDICDATGNVLKTVAFEITPDDATP
jgi:hypothetical protein